MRLEIENKGKVCVARVLESRMDAKVAPEFKQALADLVAQGQRLFVLDIAEVEFIDSSGLGAIISTLKLIGQDGDMVISGASDAVLKLFRLTRMDRVFRIFDNEQAAVAALAS